MQRGLPQKRRIAGVDKVVAIASAKGGVGKSTVSGKFKPPLSSRARGGLLVLHPGRLPSTVAHELTRDKVNVALALARQGYRVGLLDTDIFGPSVPKLLDLSGEPELSSENQLLPLQNYGVKAMSMGFLVGADSAVVWRGLMVMKAIQQLLHEVSWGGLDILVLDMPPGTGDVQLTITQQVVLDGAAVVSTPQDIALIDAVRGINMFKKTDTKVLGMIQNMSHFVCPKCNHQTDIFGTDGVVREAERHGFEILGDIPLHASICKQADVGRPTVVADPEGHLASIYHALARKIATNVGLAKI